MLVAHTPIGDVTTTMLWIGGQISSFQYHERTVYAKFYKSSCAINRVVIHLERRCKTSCCGYKPTKMLSRKQQIFILILGVSMLIMVPIFKMLTHLPPFMGMMLGVGILWIITELMHRHHAGNDAASNRRTLVSVLTRIDLPSILFFLGILLAIASLEVSGGAWKSLGRCCR